MKESVQVDSFYQRREHNPYDDQDSEDVEEEEQNLIQKAKSGLRTSIRHMNIMNEEFQRELKQVVDDAQRYEQPDVDNSLSTELLQKGDMIGFEDRLRCIN